MNMRWLLLLMLVVLWPFNAAAVTDFSDQRRSSGILQRDDAPRKFYPRSRDYRMPRGAFRWTWDVRPRRVARARPVRVIVRVVRPVITRVIRERGPKGERGERGPPGEVTPVPARPPPSSDSPVTMEPDCVEVNKAVEALPPDKLARALLRSTTRQKKIIAECQEKKQYLLEGFR